VILHPAAEDELRAIMRWYEDRGEGLGARFLFAAYRVFGRIDASPFAFPEHPNDARARRALVRSWPYVVAFALTVEGESHVVAVYHERREPGYWRNQL